MKANLELYKSIIGGKVEIEVVVRVIKYAEEISSELRSLGFALTVGMPNRYAKKVYTPQDLDAARSSVAHLVN